MCGQAGHLEALDERDRRPTAETVPAQVEIVQRRVRRYTHTRRLPTYADNATLLAIAPRRCCGAPAVRQSIDLSCPSGPQQQTSLLQRVCCFGPTLGQTDGDTVPFHRPCFAYHAGSGSNYYTGQLYCTRWGSGGLDPHMESKTNHPARCGEGGLQQMEVLGLEN